MNNIEKWVFQGDWIRGKDVDYGKDDELYYQANHNTILIKNFTLDKVESSYLYIAVLGYYIPYINGKRINEDELNSDWTNYKKGIYYDQYDITNYLKIGDNKLTIELGNGMYNPSPLRILGKYNLRQKLVEIGTPKIICDVVMDAKLLFSSDNSWLYKKGNITFNNLYLGERVDYSYCDDEEKIVLTETNNYKLYKSIIPKIKRHKEVTPVKFYQTNKGIIYDFGETLAGFINIEWIGKLNQEVTLSYSELMSDGEMDYSSCLVGSVGQLMGPHKVNGGPGSPEVAIQCDRIISKDNENYFTNKFAYHSFRYVLVENLDIEDITKISATYVYTDLSSVGEITVDNSELTELYDAATRTKLNNIHSTFEDCARERLGYGGDIVALATSNLYMFDVENFYKKIIRDFISDQTKNGGIPETSPYIGIQTNGTGQGEGPLMWQFVLPYIVKKHYQFYGDIEFVKECYPAIKKQMDYFLTYDVDELAKHCIGDHGSILINGNFKQPTPDKDLFGYCTILLFLKYNIAITEILEGSAEIYINHYQQLKNKIKDRYVNNDGTIGENTQSGLAIATLLEVIDGQVLCEKLVDQIKADNYIFNSGIFGMMFSYDVLNKYGYDHIIEQWLLREDAPSYKAMLQNGGQVLTELFTGTHQSMNHAMFSSFQQWYFQGLGGIRVLENAVACNQVKLKPYISPYINHYSCQFKTLRGMISSSWKKDKEIVEWKVEVESKDIEYEITIPDGYQLIEKIKDNKCIKMKLKIME